MRTNLGAFDRATRMTLGIMMMALGLSATVAGLPGVTLVLIGAFALLSGTLGHCPAYRLVGFSSVGDIDRLGTGAVRPGV
jgi:hypothetical protein